MALFGGSNHEHLVGVRPGIYPLPPQLSGASEPTVDSTIGAFAASAPAEVAAQMWNRSKKCASCGKINAVSMVACNGCGHSLVDAPEVFTENVPMGFVYGVAKTDRFPLKLSLRLQEESVLVYDDPLARSTCHMNAIPTDVHLPDWRWLLRRPVAGLKLLRRLEDAAWRATESNFYNHEAWRAAVVRPGVLESAADLRPHCIAALNAVVSQYQLHMHYIVPPLRPDSYHAVLADWRFERGRWLPLPYVLAALEALVAHAKASGGRAGLPDATSKDSAELFSSIEELGGPSYDKAYDAASAQYAASHEALANWEPSNFAGMATANGDGPGADYSYEAGAMGTAGAAAAAGEHSRELLKEDSKRLASYGWTAETLKGDEDPAPTSYYSHAKKVGEVQTSNAWAAADD